MNSEPNLKTIRELILKRGYGKINRQRIPLTDNQIIEEHLGKFGIISIEDIIHEVFSVGPAFKRKSSFTFQSRRSADDRKFTEVSNFLWPFKLSNPTGGWRERKFKHFIEGGDTGDREQHINSLVRRMN